MDEYVWRWMNGFEWRWIDIFGWMVGVYMVQVWRWMDNLGWIVRDEYARQTLQVNTQMANS